MFFKHCCLPVICQTNVRHPMPCQKISRVLSKKCHISEKQDFQKQGRIFNTVEGGLVIFKTQITKPFHLLASFSFHGEYRGYYLSYKGQKRQSPTF